MNSVCDGGADEGNVDGEIELMREENARRFEVEI